MAQPATKPARPTARIVHNLPAERDSFIGRQHELAKVARLLRKHRLLTVMGSAGAGKTRLAIAAAGRVERADTDRVLLVELGSVTDEQLLVQTVAAAAGLNEHSDEPILETVVATLKTMRVLVVLDNCEHLLEACAKLADTVLSRCPDMRILATSREALRITGEVTVRLDGLAVPDTGRDVSVNSLRRYDSIRLFVDRAKEILPDFRLPPAEIHAVGALCTRLDGIPLAIELAARWVPVLTVGEICARLDSRFDLLVLGGRATPNRQRSLREAIDWSYHLLAPSEQRVLRRLSVFVGAFDLDAANAVCAADGLDPVTTLDMLSRLRAKSLLTPVGTTTDFRLLESIRLYARQRLAEAGEEDSTFEALTSWLAGLAEPFVTAPLAVPRNIRVQAAEQAGSLRIACDWTSTRHDDRHVLLATALSIADANQGFLADARKVLHDALSQPQGSPRDRCAAIDRAGWYAGFQGDFTEGVHAAEEALAIARELDDPALITNCLRTLACVQQMAGDFEPALANRTECVRMVRELGDPMATATCLVHLAWSLSLLGDQERARVLAEESLAACREHRAVSRAAEALNVLGGIAIADDRLDEAENRFREVLHTDAKYPHNRPTAIEGLAIVAARRGQQKRALRLYHEAQPMRRATGLVGDPHWLRKVTDALALST
ncbi:ATP-binding protein [Actinocrispum wychmicini]|uniref:Putative ATPase n=1 Tax=Actinocrispum wychmicini TaxID=1213861 RepID=A0A4R2JAA7_9PSEU|nr:tetratricopeptide repeat protein [Actinocrispum wychmicini]TCO53578.1 putative ATPase [Actinocrispum wychmicini]